MPYKELEEMYWDDRKAFERGERQVSRIMKNEWPGDKTVTNQVDEIDEKGVSEEYKRLDEETKTQAAVVQLLPEPMPIYGIDCREPEFDEEGKPILEEVSGTMNVGDWVKLKSKYDYALLINDDAMSPYFPRKTIVIASPALRGETNCFVVAKTNKGEMFCRLLQVQDDFYLFKSTNPNFEDKIYKQSKIQIVHQVILALFPGMLNLEGLDDKK